MDCQHKPDFVRMNHILWHLSAWINKHCQYLYQQSTTVTRC